MKTFYNRPLALRVYVTNASFKQWVGILLILKIGGSHKNYLTPEIWEETHFREMFYGTLIFPQSSMICIGRHVGGHALALQHGGQNYFLLISCSTFDSYAQMCCKRHHIIFWTFSLKFKCKICVQRKVIHSLKITFWSRDHLRTYSFEENGAGLKNQITIILFKIWPTYPFSMAKSYNFHF